MYFGTEILRIKYEYAYFMRFFYKNTVLYNRFQFIENTIVLNETISSINSTCRCSQFFCGVRYQSVQTGSCAVRLLLRQLPHGGWYWSESGHSTLSKFGLCERKSSPASLHYSLWARRRNCSKRHDLQPTHARC